MRAAVIAVFLAASAVSATAQSGSSGYDARAEAERVANQLVVIDKANMDKAREKANRAQSEPARSGGSAAGWVLLLALIAGGLWVAARRK